MQWSRDLAQQVGFLCPSEQAAPPSFFLNRKTGDFFTIANDQPTVSQKRMVPRFALNCFESSELSMFIRINGNANNFTSLSQNENFVQILQHQ